MKILLASALLAWVPGLVMAQAQPTAAKTDTQAVAPKSAAHSSAKNKAEGAVAKARTTSSRVQLKSATSQVAAGFIAAETALTPDELAIAERVHVGHIACELGASVNVVADAKSPGHFHVDGKGFKFYMAPVATTTGTVRLEDQKAGAIWLQIANKSMLMDQKRGQRLADECMSPAQVVVAEAIRKNPPPSVLDAPQAR
jgi:hypothetical protein